MRYKFYIVDVFSPTPFRGNQLAVLPQAAGISAEGMQSIAREFNFAETTFVLPATDPTHTCRVRIFTPKAELPFAGHPTIGTACALVRGNHVGSGRDQDLLLEEGVGPVQVGVTAADGVWRGMLTLHTKPDQPRFAPGNTDLADVLSLPGSDVLSGFFAGVGVPFCFAHLRTPDAVDRAKIDRAVWSRVLAEAWSSNIFLFAGDVDGGAELYARMFAPALGIAEDPATGSACAALVGALAERQNLLNGTFTLSILQGVAMGRRSEIDAVARKANEAVTSVSVGGATAFVAEGEIEVPSHFVSA
jgi:trans-2,3-dihydro-3-hydroxyanthranilate isomerase